MKLRMTEDLPDWMVIEVTNGRINVTDSDTIYLSLTPGQVETFVAELLAVKNTTERTRQNSAGVH